MRSILILFGTMLIAGCSRSIDSSTRDDNVSHCLAQVKEIHGAAGPWAVVGYRIGQRALKELALPRQSFAILVTHRSPAQVQYSCIADGLQAATGASVGKLNLRMEVVPIKELSSVVEDRNSGRRLTFTLQPALIESIKDVSRAHFDQEGKRIAELPDDKIFSVAETKIPPKK